MIAVIFAPSLAWSGPAEIPEELEAEPEAAAIGLGWLFEGFNRVDVEGEALLGSDITVLRTSGSYEQERGDITVGAALGYTDLDIDYARVGPTQDAKRSEFNKEGQIDLSWQVSDQLEWSGLARAYEGFPDFRSVWIAEFYEQSFRPVPGYREADPQGWAVGTKVVWDAVPGATRLTLDLGYGEDDIVQGWNFGAAGLEAGPSRLETSAGGLIWEQAITGWLKMQSSFRAQEVSLREPRFQLQTNWAAAIGPDWTVRVNAGGTRERPSFEAYYAGAVVDYQFAPGWHVSAHGRLYEDTGEIESSGFSTAAPGMQAFEVGASLLYEKDNLAVRLYGGFYHTDFDPLDATNFIFGKLYANRDWWVTRLAVSYSF